MMTRIVAAVAVTCLGAFMATSASAQTAPATIDERVNQVTPALFALADNAHGMARQDVDEIRDIIRPCGLSPQKSKAIRRLSQILIEEHGGEWMARWDREIRGRGESLD